MRWLWRGGVLGLVLVLVMVAATVDGQTTALAGVIDFHVHSGPDSRPRSVSDLEIARIAKRAGMPRFRRRDTCAQTGPATTNDEHVTRVSSHCCFVESPQTRTQRSDRIVEAVTSHQGETVSKPLNSRSGLPDPATGRPS